MNTLTTFYSPEQNETLRAKYTAWAESEQAGRLQAVLEERARTERNWYTCFDALYRRLAVRQLLTRAPLASHAHRLESWWLEYGYLRPRYPIAGIISFYAGTGGRRRLPPCVH